MKKVLGFLRGLDFDGLVDVGSGRGAFLVPFLPSSRTRGRRRWISRRTGRSSGGGSPRAACRGLLAVRGLAALEFDAAQRGRRDAA
ncbi:MAG: hypothetical protein ACLUEK_09850 [Oscillospiraceae bacterium]